jgi:hypothetical protein
MVDPVDAYRYAQRTLRSVGAQRMAVPDWNAFDELVSAMLAALEADDVPSLEASTGGLALMSDGRQDATVDPDLVEQPRHSRTASAKLSEYLEQQLARYEKEAQERSRRNRSQ